MASRRGWNMIKIFSAVIYSIASFIWSIIKIFVIAVFAIATIALR